MHLDVSLIQFYNITSCFNKIFTKFHVTLLIEEYYYNTFK